MTQNELDKILKLHEKWLYGEKDGRRANLNNVDLKNTNLAGAILSNADLTGANLTSADLSNANLVNADLTGANLIDANLRRANLRRAYLSNADLTGANLIDANLKHANLKNTNLYDIILTGANLNDANLKGAKLKGAYTDETTAFFYLQCPEEGSYIAYKKCQEDRIVKLFIPADAKRSSATTRKCRASKAKVLSITNINGTENFDIAFSYYDCSFVYKVGEIVEVEDFDENRWNKCGTGIHHFITRNEAINYII